MKDQRLAVTTAVGGSQADLARSTWPALLSRLTGDRAAGQGLAQTRPASPANMLQKVV